jgi:hypothetical protein
MTLELLGRKGSAGRTAGSYGDPQASLMSQVGGSFIGIIQV